MHGVGGEDDAAEAEIPDHLLGGGDFVRFVLDLGVRQNDGRAGGEGRQCLGRPAVVDVVEAGGNNWRRDRRGATRPCNDKRHLHPGPESKNQ